MGRRWRRHTRETSECLSSLLLNLPKTCSLNLSLSSLHLGVSLGLPKSSSKVQIPRRLLNGERGRITGEWEREVRRMEIRRILRYGASWGGRSGRVSAGRYWGVAVEEPWVLGKGIDEELGGH